MAMTMMEMQAEHPKRFAAMLRYIASMQHGADSRRFVREFNRADEAKEALKREFNMNGDGGANNNSNGNVGGIGVGNGEEDAVMFSYESFRSLPHINDQSLFASPPFSFYAAASETEASMSSWGRKKSSSGANSCWIRLTRLKAEEPPAVPSLAVEAYLANWAAQRHLRSYRRLVRSVDALSRTPAPDVNTSARHQKEIKSHLSKCRRWAKRDAIRRKLEPMYDSLFETAQRARGADVSFEECILGLGNARMLAEEGGGAGVQVVNGPLLEVRVEVELTPDGALLLRPCQHTGVEMNREVLRALSSDRGILSSLHRAVSEIDPQSISPGQPGTFVALLKRIAVEVSSAGRFISTVSPSYASMNASRESNKLIITDSWCLYHRPKPSRDAQTLADQISFKAGCSAMSFLGWRNPQHERPLFPLPTSASQHRIHRLLADGAPAVVVEGPPGTGKTNSIGNIVCSYLAQGKRVLVTSKGAPALSVLRQRLPDCIRELCVDITTSESNGMKQLQQTVERLADRVSRGVDMTELCKSLAHQIKDTESDISMIDSTLESFRGSNKLMQSPEGLELADLACTVLADAPWLASSLSSWEDTKLNDFVKKVETLTTETGSYDDVTGYSSPPSASLLAGVASQAGFILPTIINTTAQAFSYVPLVGTLSGARTYQDCLSNEVSDIQLCGWSPSNKSDWIVVHNALERDRKHWLFYVDTLQALIEKEEWPRDFVYDSSKTKLCFHQQFANVLRKVQDARCKQAKLLPPNILDQSAETQLLEARRHKMTKLLQELDQKLVEARVLSELNRAFSPDAQSALLQFAQLAGKARFKSGTQTGKLSARQQRHRQNYLKAFEDCVRYIPCWICTHNQGQDYLPPEFGLFDLVIIDEASQSDISALPSLCRGKQWLVVGDGKQVSPTEGFVAESVIETLRASLPHSPFQELLLPGNSIFDLCLAAFPLGRVVLTEHFRCAPEIINFSNKTYYQGRLQPLRLPTSAEALTPSLIDVYLRNGRKVGKQNEEEANLVVNMIADLVKVGQKAQRQQRHKTIGVISLVGDEQSRLIRRKLLDKIEPEAYRRHGILVGEPPSFQGSERDIIFLSMVSSPGSVPTQSQQMYHQRINVALSRARDRMVLVRSINRSHIPSNEDAKVAVIDFFGEFASKDISDDSSTEDDDCSFVNSQSFNTKPMRQRIVGNITSTLAKAGYKVRPMGVVWEGGICVEDEATGDRAAINIEHFGELKQEWAAALSQQRAIERVGWQCYRLDAFAWLLNCRSAMQLLQSFLCSAAVNPKKKFAEEGLGVDNASAGPPRRVNNVPEDDTGSSNNDDGGTFVRILSDDESKVGGNTHQGNDSNAVNGDEESDGIDPNQYGSVITLCGLTKRASNEPYANYDSSEDGSIDQGATTAAETCNKSLLARNLRAKRAPQKRSSASGKPQTDSSYCYGGEAGTSSSSSESERPARNKRRRWQEKQIHCQDSELERKSKAKNDTSQGSVTNNGQGTIASDDDYHRDDDSLSSNEIETPAGKNTRRRRRQRLDAHSRDPRWYPSHEPNADRGDADIMDVEEEVWEDLKDVVYRDSSCRNDEDGSIVSRLRNSPAKSIADD
ncbi:hypothetical protein ACHAWF_012762 [Thalassiosira exigua]